MRTRRTRLLSLGVLALAALAAMTLATARPASANDFWGGIYAPARFLPDLTVTDGYSWLSTYQQRGIAFTVRNQGDDRTRVNFRVIVKNGGFTVAEYWIYASDPLWPGQSRILSPIVASACYAALNLTIIVDPDNFVYERSEANNQLALSLPQTCGLP